MRTASRTFSWLVVATVLGFGVSGYGCKQADYAADLTNRTPEPIVAQLYRKSDSGVVLGQQRRLGPGDRAFVGPVRTDVPHGAFLSVDSMGNPGRPVTLDLMPGAARLEVHQDGQGPDARLRVVEKQ